MSTPNKPLTGYAVAAHLLDSAPTTRDAVAAVERIADERLDLQRERIALRAEVQRLTAAYDALADKHAALVVECDTLRAALGGEP